VTNGDRPAARIIPFRARGGYERLVAEGAGHPGADSGALPADVSAEHRFRPRPGPRGGTRRTRSWRPVIHLDTSAFLGGSPSGPADLGAALARSAQVVIDCAVIRRARAIPEVVKPLGAIHIASAETLGDDLERVVTCDRATASAPGAGGVPCAGASASAGRRLRSDSPGRSAGPNVIGLCE
jgi:hypothetical protein